MNWRNVALSAAMGLCLFPQLSQAQDEVEAQKEQAAPTPEASTAPKEEVKVPVTSSGGKGLLGDFRFGPSVALGLPHPLTGGLDVVYADLLGLSFSSGRFGLNVEDTELEIRNWDMALRWFPFRGTFFLGAAYGNQGLVGKLTKDMDINYNGIPLTVPTTIRLEIESDYLTPQLGWFARWDFGLTLGFEIGYQMPSGAKTDMQTSFKNVSTAAESEVRKSQEYKDAEEDVKKVGDAFGNMAIPYISFLKIGWLF